MPLDLAGGVAAEDLAVEEPDRDLAAMGLGFHGLPLDGELDHLHGREGDPGHLRVLEAARVIENIH